MFSLLIILSVLTPYNINLNLDSSLYMTNILSVQEDVKEKDYLDSKQKSDPYVINEAYQDKLLKVVNICDHIKENKIKLNNFELCKEGNKLKEKKEILLSNCKKYVDKLYVFEETKVPNIGDAYNAIDNCKAELETSINNVLSEISIEPKWIIEMTDWFEYAMETLKNLEAPKKDIKEIKNLKDFSKEILLYLSSDIDIFGESYKYYLLEIRKRILDDQSAMCFIKNVGQISCNQLPLGYSLKRDSGGIEKEVNAKDKIKGEISDISTIEVNARREAIAKEINNELSISSDSLSIAYDIAAEEYFTLQKLDGIYKVMSESSQLREELNLLRQQFNAVKEGWFHKPPK